MDDQTISVSLEFAVSAKQCFSRWTLKKGARLGVDGRAEKIIRGSVTDVELDAWIECDQLHQIDFAKSSLLVWRLRLERFCAQFLNLAQRRDAEADLLREAERQQSEKESTRTEIEFSQKIHLPWSEYCSRAISLSKFPTYTKMPAAQAALV
jgi:hypothetical protein